MKTRRKRVWRVIVTVADQPVEGEDYITAAEIAQHIDGSPQAGVEIRVVEAKDMGEL